MDNDILKMTEEITLIIKENFSSTFEEIKEGGEHRLEWAKRISAEVLLLKDRVAELESERKDDEMEKEKIEEVINLISAWKKEWFKSKEEMEKWRIGANKTMADMDDRISILEKDGTQ